jgi:hypothetical protein
MDLNKDLYSVHATLRLTFELKLMATSNRILAETEHAFRSDVSASVLRCTVQFMQNPTFGACVSLALVSIGHVMNHSFGICNLQYLFGITFRLTPGSRLAYLRHVI